MAARGGSFQGGSGTQHMFPQVGRFQNINMQSMTPSTFQYDKKITTGTFITPVASTWKMATHQ
jgi:hypothetical protein